MYRRCDQSLPARAGALARLLSTEGATWAAAKNDPGSWSATLGRCDGLVLSLRLFTTNNQLRYGVSAVWPTGTGAPWDHEAGCYRDFSITVAASRGLPCLAREIERRLLPGFEPYWRERQRMAEAERRGKRAQRRIAGRLARDLGAVKSASDGSLHIHGEGFSIRIEVPATGDAESHCRASFEASQATTEQVARMVALVRSLGLRERPLF